VNDERQLLDRLHALLSEEAARRGDTIDRLDENAVDLEVYPVGQSGVMALINGYVIAAWPRRERIRASVEAFQILHLWLRERGVTKHMVHPLNFPSVIVTRKLGAVPIGVDRDGFVHYNLTLEAFEERHHGKEEPAPEGS
jgi:predicted xylose isomerase-like sugar epimerase